MVGVVAIVGSNWFDGPVGGAGICGGDSVLVGSMVAMFLLFICCG